MENLSKNKAKFIRALQMKKNRIESGYFIAEGEKIIREIVAYRPDLVELIVTTDSNLDLSQDIPTELASRQQMEQISALRNHNGILALVRQSIVSSKQESKIIVLLDDIQDPGNLGTIIRICDWFGIEQIICSPDTVDCFNPKVIQATMGSFLRVGIDYRELSAFINDYQNPVFGTFMEGQSIYTCEPPEKFAVVIGNEGKGISEQVEQFIHHRLTIPRIGHAESLNASIATGIILSHLTQYSSK